MANNSHRSPNNQITYRRRMLILVILSVSVFIISLLLGRYPEPGFISLSKIIEEPLLAQSILLNLRLPRVITASLLGMTLSAAGLVFQSLFANPIVEPGFLGVSSGAAFGAAIGIIFFGTTAIIIQTSAIFFSLAGLAISLLIARNMKSRNWIIRLVLAGIMVSAFFTAGVGIMKSVADPLRQLPEITFWLLGGLWSITWARLFGIAIPVIIGLLILYLVRWRINVLSLDEQIAFSSGVPVVVERNFLLTVSVIMVASMISIAGIVNWVGLLIPHIARRFFGGNANYTIPASMLLGLIFTVSCDTIGRTISPGEIPLGILTALFGSILFVFLMTGKNSSSLEGAE